MSLGQILAGGGNVLRGWRNAEEAERVARQNQLAIEEQNRLNRLRQLAAQQSVPQAPNLSANLGQPGQVVDVPLPPVAAAPAPVVPGRQPLPPGVTPSNAGAGRGNINPPLVGQPQPTYPPTSAAPGTPLTPQQMQVERDRLALLRTPTAALDVIQAPAAAGLNLASRVANATGLTELGGRVINAVTGRETVPAGAQLPSFSMTPFYDRYVRQGEQALAEGRSPRQQPSDSATPAPTRTERDPRTNMPMVSEQPTTRGAQYDARRTPYDDIIAQAAQQNGIDPVIFKRLIGTESSFDPNAVSPRGARFGLGIAQIAASHGLSDADRKNPQIAIPFAARLYAQYLNEAGGDHQEALLRYKGASSERGRASMAGPVADILSGIVPSAQAAQVTAAPGQPATTAAAAPAEAPTRLEPSQFYRANPEAVPRDIQIAMENRAELVRMAQLYQQAGMGMQFMQLRAQIVEADRGLFYLQGMQGIQELEYARDPRRLGVVLSNSLGTPVGIVPRTDGKFNVMVNGAMYREGMTTNEVADMARSSFDAAYRTAKSEQATRMSEKMQDAMIEIQKGNATELARMIRETTVEGVKGNNALALEWLKANANWDVKPTGAGDGTVIIRPPGSPPYLFNPNGRAVEIDGVKVPANSAVAIGGLPQATRPQLTQTR